MVRRALLTLCFLAIAALGAGCNDPRVSAANRLLDAYRGACVTTGRWTDAALQHNAALSSVVRSLLDDDPCKEFATQLTHIQDLSTQINGLLTETAFADYRLAEEKLQELTLGLGAASDPDLAAALKTEILTTQVDLAGKRAATTVAGETAGRDRYARATEQLGRYVQGLIGESGTISGCLQRRPEAAVQLATNLIAIGGSFISPIYGAAAAAVGQLLNFGIEAIREWPAERTILRLEQDKMPLALSCGLQAMTELYCQASDSFALVELQATSYPEPGFQPDAAWRGLDLVGRRMPILSQWLLSIKNGVEPNDPTDAERQNQVWGKLQKFENISRFVIGWLNKTRQLYQGSEGSPEVQKRFLFGFVRDFGWGMSGKMDGSGRSESTPFTEYSSDPFEYACWIVKGPDATCPAHSNNDSLDVYIQTHLLAQASMEGLFRNWKAIADLVKARVDLEFLQTITVNPKAAIAAAYESPSPESVSPREVATLLLTFLRDLRARPAHPERLRLLDDTITLVTLAMEKLDDPALTPLAKVQAIFTSFQLGVGTQIINQLVSDFVKWDLQDRLRSGELPQDVADILRSAGGDIRARLLASGVVDIDLVKDDLNKARGLARTNVVRFREFFRRSIGKSLAHLERQAIDSGEPEVGPNRPYGEQLGELCALAVSAGYDWTKDAWRICEGASMYSTYPNRSSELTLRVAELRRQMEGKPDLVRLCGFHRYLRARRLAETLRPLSPKALVDWVLLAP